MKIDRLLAITVLLLNRGRVSAAELADRFEVSTKTIYRDMDTLNQAGIPVVAHQGTTGGFEIMEHYTIHRQFLTLDEITSVVAAIKGMGTAIEDKNIDNLLEKVQTLLSRSDLQATDQGARIVFDFNPWGQGPDAKSKVSLLKTAIERLQLIRFSYSNMNGTQTERMAEPCSLILKGHLWYLHAFCRLRNEFRMFRLTRMQDLELMEGFFVRREAPSLDRYEWNQEWSRHHIREVVLTFSPEVRYRVQDMFSPELITQLPGGMMRVKGLYPVDEWFYGMILSFGEQVRIEQPVEVADEICRRVQRILSLYPNPDTQMSTFPK
ncbi:YafY family transcriptional regulator [Paenibacillus zeisoli]|uniref:YafY family transcriptional regulator n=1 Tax=Paenibacillus zeisoli TaxID=2496267 RepID=A0A433XHI2_9BACL|nr:YafY family protein [Paenibacillus zeisoli]RUT33537.1 YafY family transcriptional regulator [Paenibacillus zeisoli]